MAVAIFSRSLTSVAATISLAVAFFIAANALPVEAKSLVFCSEGSPENFYPGASASGITQDATHQIYDRLVHFERGSAKAVPGLAERWTIAENGTVYTFHLRRGVKWHANANFRATRDFNADDVLFSIERQWKEDHPYYKVTSANHAYFTSIGLPKLLKSVEKIDDYTVRFTLTRFEAPFLYDLAMEFAAIQSKEYADQMLAAGTPEKLDLEPIGTGPFVLLQHKKDVSIHYMAFPGYWAGPANIDELVFAVTPDAATRWSRLQRGECDVMANPDPADLAAMRKDANIVVMEQAGHNIAYLAYNTQKKPFDDVRVRKALNLAINKRAIIDAVYPSTGTAAINPIPPTLWSYNKSTPDEPYRPASAKKLLAEAGHPDGFTTDLWAMSVQRPYMPNGKRVAEMIQADLAQIGVKAEIKTYEWGEYLARMQNGEHQMGLLGWTSDNADPDNFLHTLLGCEGAVPGGLNVAKWCHEDFQRLVSQGKVNIGITERLGVYEQAQALFKKQAPWFTIAHAKQIMPMRKDVADFVLSPFGLHDFHGVNIGK